MITKKVSGCPFCAMKDGARKKLEDICPKLESARQIYLVTKNLVSTVDAHPILPETPYFLIVPKEHFTSFRRIEMFEEELNQHIEFLKKCVERSYPNSKKNLITFEHGQSIDGKSAKSVYHAHWHLLFTDFNANHILDEVTDRLQKMEVSYELNFSEKTSIIAEIKKHLDLQDDYLYFSANNARLTILDNEHEHDKFPSQFFRVIIAEACNIEFINWKETTNDHIIQFRERLYNSLPANINEIEENEKINQG
jgi:diadenosine tetraphosphate (Ap4A) HIT family hydrolase